MMETLKAALKSTGYEFAHYAWASDAKQRKRDHGIYAEDGQNVLHASNGRAETAVQGTVHYFTRDDSGAPQKAIEAALEAAEGVAWYLDTIQYEQDTGFIHYAWVFECL